MMECSKHTLFLSLFCGVLINVALCSAHADEQVSEEVWQKKAAEMYQQVLSPFCPGRSLNDCPSSKAQELKTEMLVKLQSGVQEQEVLEGVFAKFGDQYRAIPKGEGFGRLVWLVPGGFVCAGLALAYFVSTRRTAGSIPSAPTGKSVKAITAEEEAELSRELENLD